MPLSKSVLEKHLKAMAKEGGSSTFADAASKWANMYHEYAAAALAGVMKPTGFVKKTIESAILANTGDFYTAIESAMSQYWSPIAWAGPGLVGITISAAGVSGMLSSKAQDLMKASAEEAPAIIAGVLHNHALSITVQATTPAGVVSIVKVV